MEKLKKEIEFENFIIPNKGSKIFHINEGCDNYEKNLLIYSAKSEMLFKT